MALVVSVGDFGPHNLLRCFLPVFPCRIVPSNAHGEAEASWLKWCNHHVIPADVIATDEYRYEIQIIGRLQVCPTDYDIEIKMQHYTNRTPPQTSVGVESDFSFQFYRLL